MVVRFSFCVTDALRRLTAVMMSRTACRGSTGHWATDAIAAAAGMRAYTAGAANREPRSRSAFVDDHELNADRITLARRIRIQPCQTTKSKLRRSLPTALRLTDGRTSHVEPYPEVTVTQSGSRRICESGVRVHSSLKERAGVKRGFGLRFRGFGGV